MPVPNKDYIVLGLRAATRDSHEAARRGGWYTDLATGHPKERNIPEMLALIHSEISEALEGVRKVKQDEHLPSRTSVEVELTDALIRIFDLAGYLKLDLGLTYVEKRLYNEARQDHTLGARRAKGGKAF